MPSRATALRASIAGEKGEGGSFNQANGANAVVSEPRLRYHDTEMCNIPGVMGSKLRFPTPALAHVRKPPLSAVHAKSYARVVNTVGL